MVFLLQVLMFALFTWLRGRSLSGMGYPSHIHAPEHIWSFTEDKYGLYKSHVIGLKHEKSMPFIVRRERWYHRLLLWLGVASELDLKDAEFDRKYYFITDYPTHLEQALANTDLLEHLKQLFALPVEELRMSPTRIWCHIKRKDAGKPKAHFDAHYDLLAEIAKDVEAQPSPTRRQKQLGATAFGFLSIHNGLALLGAFGFLPMLWGHHVDILNNGEWIAYSFLFAAAASLLWFVVIFNVFARSSWVCWVLADFLLVGLFGIFSSSVYLTRDANIYLPQPPATTLEKPVLNRECVLECKKKTGRRSSITRSYAMDDLNCTPGERPRIMAEMQATNNICASKAWYEYHLTIPNWEYELSQQERPYRFKSQELLYDSSRVGDNVAISLHPGALGIPWIDTSRIEAVLPDMPQLPASKSR